MSKATPIYRRFRKGQAMVVAGVPIHVIKGQATLLFLPTDTEKVVWGIDKPKKRNKI